MCLVLNRMNCKLHGEVCAWPLWRELCLAMLSRESERIYPAWAFLPNPASAWIAREFQLIILKDSHYSSRKYKQRRGWRRWAFWRHYSPCWTQSWSLRGQYTDRSPSSGGVPQNHPAREEQQTEFEKCSSFPSHSSLVHFRQIWLVDVIIYF